MYRNRRPMSGTGVLKLVGFIFIVIGGIFALIGGGFGVENWLYVNSAQSTVGTVVGLDYSGGRGARVVVQYQTTSGQTIEAAPGLRSNPPMAQVGETVKLYYQANNPTDLRLNHFVNMWLFPLIFGGLGTLFLVIGVGLVILGTVLGANRTRPATAL